MTREEVMTRLRSHESELRSSGLAALYLFGSTARDERRSGSDVDLLCDIDVNAHVGLLEFMELRDRLSALLRSRVDLVSREGLRPRIRTRVEPEMMRIF